MSIGDGLQILQSAVVLLAASPYAAVLWRADTIVQSNRRPSIFQPYRDPAELLRKGSAVSDEAFWVFRGAPFVALTVVRPIRFGGVSIYPLYVLVLIAYLIHAY
ncbi:MAG TPA: hypothetical protein VMG74_04650 [Gaiellaceae bacterium]|nr:hypothetical protein [Gaiellaceae bacterium]